MTLRDYLLIIRRNLKLMIALPIVFVLFTVIWCFFTQTTYTATASFVTNGDLAFAKGIADTQAATYSNADVNVACTSVSSSKQIAITASGPDSSICIETVNNVAREAAKKCEEATSNVSIAVSEANYAANNTRSLLENAFIAMCLGILLAFCIIVFLDYIQCPIRSRKDAETSSALPVLGEVPSPEGGERLLANTQFRYGERPSTIAVVPVGTEATAPITARELAGALERSDVRVKLVKGSPHAKKFQVTVPEDAAIVVSCEPLDVGMGAAYIAHNADVTVLCVSEWTDSRRQLTATVQELELAKANTAGIAYLPEEKKPREPRRPKDPEGE